MRTEGVREALSAAFLLVVLGWAIRRPRGWPEAFAAVPSAALLVAIGAVSGGAALGEIRRLGPVTGFLGCVLVLAKLCDDDGLFRFLGGWLTRGAAGRGGSNRRDGQDGRDEDGAPARLLRRVFAIAAVTTAVLSLDTTVVLLTPAVLSASRRLDTPPRAHAYACGHLANSASLLLPVSNLTNLLAFTVSRLSFGRFTALMTLPWLAAIGVEYAVISRFFAADLRGAVPVPAAAVPVPAAAVPVPAAGEDEDTPGIPVFSLAVVGLTLAGFLVCSAAEVSPAWAALGGVLLLAGRELARGRASALSIARGMDVPFLLFVLALGVVVTAVASNGLASVLRPTVPSGTSLPDLAGIAALAAALAAAVNNLPAVLLLLPLASPLGAGPVLAVLLGVNIGPNLTYTGSLATLLWRRVLRGYALDVPLGEFTAVAVASAVPALALAVVALWAGLRLFGG